METIALTYAQKFINYVMTRISPAAPALHLVTCARIKGQIEPKSFEQAATVLAARHPVICARLDLSGNEVVQRQGCLVPSIEIIDIGADTDVDVDVTLSALADKPFDLFQENPFRVIVARACADETFLLLQVHHMFIDAISLNALLEEYLSIVCGDDRDPREAHLHDVDSSFFSWARRERRMLDDGIFAKRAQNWLRRLQDADPALHIRERGADPVLQSIESISFHLDPQQFQKFADRAHRLGVSNFALATAAVFHTLREVTAQDSILLSVVSGARRTPFERTIGQFAQTFMIKQYARDIEMPERAARLIYKEVMNTIYNYIPVEYFAAQVDCLKDRVAKGFSTTDVYINYLQPPADLEKHSVPGKYEISLFPITSRTQHSDIPYHGMTAGFFILPKNDSIDGLVRYESAIISARTADQISTSLQCFLTREK